MRKSLAVLALLVVVLASTAFATNYSVANSYSGWYNGSGNHSNANTHYISGPGNGDNWSNFFDFNLAGVSGTVTGATFTVNTYVITGPGTYTMYATSLTSAIDGDCSGCTATYNALTSGPAIGSIALDSTNSSSYVTLTFNAAGLSWLQANEGSQIVAGGFFAAGPADYAFGFSGFDGNNHLLINAVPEPGTLVMFGSGLLGLAGIARRKFNL